jgi:hypothetical protein
LESWRKADLLKGQNLHDNFCFAFKNNEIREEEARLIFGLCKLIECNWALIFNTWKNSLFDRILENTGCGREKYTRSKQKFRLIITLLFEFFVEAVLFSPHLCNKVSRSNLEKISTIFLKNKI